MSGLVQERQKAPWLWFDVVYDLTSSGKKHRSALGILHGFTNKVNVVFCILVSHFFSAMFSMIKRSNKVKTFSFEHKYNENKSTRQNICCGTQAAI